MSNLFCFLFFAALSLPPLCLARLRWNNGKIEVEEFYNGKEFRPGGQSGRIDSNIWKITGVNPYYEFEWEQTSPPPPAPLSRGSVGLSHDVNISGVWHATISGKQALVVAGGDSPDSFDPDNTTYASAVVARYRNIPEPVVAGDIIVLDADVRIGNTEPGASSYVLEYAAYANNASVGWIASTRSFTTPAAINGTAWQSVIWSGSGNVTAGAGTNWPIGSDVHVRLRHSSWTKGGASLSDAVAVLSLTITVETTQPPPVPIPPPPVVISGNPSPTPPPDGPAPSGCEEVTQEDCIAYCLQLSNVHFCPLCKNEEIQCVDDPSVEPFPIVAVIAGSVGGFVCLCISIAACMGITYLYTRRPSKDRRLSSARHGGYEMRNRSGSRSASDGRTLRLSRQNSYYRR